MKRWLPVLAALFAIGATQAQTCDTLLLSGYFSGNVHLYDACTGQYQRNLAAGSQLAGAQASKIGPDGRLYVVAEGRDRIVRYDAQTLEFIDEPITLTNQFGATGIAFRDNEIWIASYSLNLVRRFDLATGQPIGNVFGAGAGGLGGPDNGMTFGPDGNLYVPGYDSNSVVRHNPATGSTSEFIAPGAGGLFETRGILFEPGGQTVLISSEGSGDILRFAASDGRFITRLISGLNRPTGLGYHSDGSLLVADNNGITRFNASTGANIGRLAEAAAGGARGVTYLTVLPRGDAPPVVDDSQIGSQYWITGAGPMTGNVIDIQDMASSVGTSFGVGFDPDRVVRKRWGSARIVFTSCTTGQFSWDSSGDGTAQFGDGSYAIERLLDSDATRRCETAGFSNVDNRDWVIGSWYGGPSRDGEGLMLDLNTDGIAFLAWFTYRPQQ